MRIPLFLLLGAALALAACNGKPMIEPSTPVSNSQLKSANRCVPTRRRNTGADAVVPHLTAWHHPVYLAGDENSNVHESRAFAIYSPKN